MRVLNSIIGKYTFVAATILLLLATMVAATFYLTDEIRGDASRINLAGRQRMHVFHLANHAHFLLYNGETELEKEPLHLAQLDMGRDAYGKVLYCLKDGCPEYNISPSPKSAAHEGLNTQLDGLITLWEQKQTPYLLQIKTDPILARKEGEKLCAGCHDAFVHHFKEVDDFVFALAQHNEQVIWQFNLLRFGILAVSGFSAILMVIFVKQQMVRPVRELHDATIRLEQGDFSCRVAPRTNDEIGILSQAFNRMAATLALSFNEKEAIVQQRTAELQTANDELKTFAYTVSHDLRAPLRAIQGFAGAIQEDGQGLDPRLGDHVANLVAAAEFMDKLIVDLLSYSQISFKDIHRSNVDLGLLLNEVMNEMAGEIQQVDGQISIEGCLPGVIANHGIMIQVVMNLLSNAMKFVKAGVRPKIRVWAQHYGDKVRLFVNDNGIGIAPGDQQRIFEVFVRLHGMDSYPGTGIGLATVRKGIDRLGGSCGVESTPGQGSTFWLELPLAAHADLSSIDDHSLLAENKEVDG